MGQRVIIIGAGIIGSTTAYYLQKAGADVTVLDSGAPSATAASFGWINASFFLDRDHFHLRNDAIAAYRDLTDELVLPVNWCGCLCFDNQGDALDAQIATLRDLGYDFEELDADRFAALVPDLQAPPARSLLFRQEAAMESGAVVHHLLTAAKGLGARVMRGVTVNGFVMNGDTVTGVDTVAGQYDADMVVSAVGTASQDLLAEVDVPLPLLPRPAVMLRTRPVRTLMDHVLVTDIGEIRQLPDGTLTMPAAVSHQSDRSDALHAAVDVVADEALARLQALFPDVPLSWDEARMAHRPVPRDELPVVGAVKKGLYIACMHSGITLGALMGQQIAQEVLQGPTNATAKRLAPYRPERFAKS